ncbi:hypothetical protein ACFCYF_41795 [Streptomyces chartreusis]|uniref:hypothetical protein n=1 Tax=Streptomyces chartreusis TaxID=1969 RepID=UPI0035E1F364
MTAPLRPEGTPDPDGLPVYVQPVDDAGQPLAQPRRLDPAFSRRKLHAELRKARQDSALAQLAEPIEAEPIWLNTPPAWNVRYNHLSVVVQFKSEWADSSRTASNHSWHQLQPVGGLAQRMNVLCLWQPPQPSYGAPAHIPRMVPYSDWVLKGEQPVMDAQHFDVRQRASLDRARSTVLLAGPRGADPWLAALERDPDMWREAAASVLLEDDWEANETTPDRGSVSERFIHRLNHEVRNWRGTWEHQLNRRRVALLSEPLCDDHNVESFVPADRHCTERTALDRLEVTGNPCVLKIMAKLTTRETQIADIYARTDLSWEQAAELAGQEPQAGNTVSKKLRRLGRDHVRRAQNARGAPSGPRCPHSPEPVPTPPRT